MGKVFDDSDGPRVFATPLGVDFCAALIDGLLARLDRQPPEAIARVELIVANARMERRVRSLFLARGPGFLPRIRPVLALAEAGDPAGLPPAIPPLRLRLQLVQLIGRLLQAQPDLAPRSALYDLADSLADLMGEMFEEGVAPGDLARLDVTDHAGHWQRARAFLSLVSDFIGDDAALTREARQTRVVAELAQTWRQAPPDHPVIVAGSTGSRGTTARLMEAVAGLPQGAVILPGIDRDMPRAVWDGLPEGRRAGLAGEDHPQYRLARFAERVGLDPWDIPDWPGSARPGAARTAAISLALRPAPVTDQWRLEGPKLTGLAEGFAGVTLLEAPSPQMEAAAIALRLRQAVEEGRRAALICPDRTLARQVTAALDRWAITPDDSAGAPVAQTAPGRFLRHVAELEAAPADSEALIVLLKHPICHSGGERGPHLRRTRDLEVDLLRRRPGLPTRARLVAWAETREGDPAALDWVGWIADLILTAPDPRPIPMEDRVARHIARAEALAAGPGQAGSGTLYDHDEGGATAMLVAELQAEAGAGGDIPAMDYRDLFTGLAEDREARQSLYPHADVLIWGTQEARVQGADLMILAGLNEGTWPMAPAPDPWLNRALRAEAGLRLPDRVIGLAAHDFQQAIAAPEVWITRAVRDAETDTVAARWLNRLVNLLEGSGSDAGAALADMRARGARYLAMAERLVTPDDEVPAEPRPAPAPPAGARLTRIAVTEVERLVRDPYAVYARRVLNLHALDPLRALPDARLRGTILHKVMARFVQDSAAALPDAATAIAALMRITDAVLAEDAPWPAARRLWTARMARVAPFVLEVEADLRARGTPLLQEVGGEWPVPGTGVTLRGTADRIDAGHDGSYGIYDYKTGAPPTEGEEEAFNRQLWLEALMAEAGAFGLPAGAVVRHIAYIGLGSAPAIRAHGVDAATLAQVRARFAALMAAFADPRKGFPSRRAIKSIRFAGDYDHLARHGEWDDADPAVTIPVGVGGGR